MNFDEKVKKIKEFVFKNGYEYMEIKDENLLNIVYDLFINNKIPVADQHAQFKIPLLRLIAGYFYIKKENYFAIKYLDLAIKAGDGDAMGFMGKYFQESGNYESALNCYQRAIEMGSGSGYYRIAWFYRRARPNHIKMAHYYELSIASDEEYSLYSMIEMFEMSCVLSNDHQNIKKYLNMAIAKNNKHEKVLKSLNKYLNDYNDPKYANLHSELLDEENREKYNIHDVCEL